MEKKQKREEGTKDLSLTVKIRRKLIGGGFHIYKVPFISKNNNPKKIFLVFYEYITRVDSLIRVLSAAEWGGSTVLITMNYPSLANALQAGGADYLVQACSYSYPDDLYNHFIKDEPYAKEWKDRIIKFDEFEKLEKKITIHWSQV